MKVKDRVEDCKIILHDDGKPGPKVLKKVEIRNADGSVKKYEIKKTRRGGYLFN